MRICPSLILLTAVILLPSCLSQQEEPEIRKLLTCFKCLGNDTRCSNTCTGNYCYKQEATTNIDGVKRTKIKRGCVNRTDSLSRLNDCSPRPQQLPGGSILTELFCLCDNDRCNSAGLLSTAVPFVFSIVFCLLLN